MDKARFEAFSDGVFAFAITLLALGFALPGTRLTSDSELRSSLLALWPNLIAYALSFAVIGIMWQNHHALFRLVRRVDRQSVFWNLMLLGCVVFIPFATSTLGSYPTMSSSAFLYGVALSANATCFNLMLRHLVSTNAFQRHVSSATVGETVRAYRTGWAIYLSATVLALFAPIASFVAYVLVAVYYLVPRGIDSDIGVGPE